MIDKIFIIILLTYLMVIFGTCNHNNFFIEYPIKNFDNIVNIINIRKKLRQNVLDDPNIDIENITEHIKHGTIPNLVNAYYICLKPHSITQLKKYISDKYIYIIFNETQNLDLLIHNTISKKYYYPLKNKISITNTFPLCNNTDFTINITLFIIKKPYWIHLPSAL